MLESEQTNLPSQFSELNGFVDQWCNDDMAAQYAARLSSTMPEMQSFYEAVKMRVADIREYLDQIAFEDYTEADAALGRLLIGWVPVAEAIEVFKQIRVPDSKGYWELVEEPHSF
ncbi:MAG: hypothetical protein AAF542_03865 [Pseudomonadota bacterium]